MTANDVKSAFVLWGVKSGALLGVSPDMVFGVCAGCCVGEVSGVEEGVVGEGIGVRVGLVEGLGMGVCIGGWERVACGPTLKWIVSEVTVML